MEEIRPKIWYDYMRWLVDQVHFDKKGYQKLIKHLHDIPFEVSPEALMDENRAGDGVYQRYYFFKSLGLKDGEMGYPCSILEMLTAFTIRMGDNYLGYDPRDNKDHYEWIFWMFLKNLELDEMDDRDFVKEEVDSKIGYFVLRDYKDDGIGSLFPLKRSVRGYNQMEIWKQMNIFLEQMKINDVSDLETLY